MARKRKTSVAEAPLRFSKTNLWFALAGLATIAAGYYVLSLGSVTLAPVLLVVGYVVFLPLAIIR